MSGAVGAIGAGSSSVPVPKKSGGMSFGDVLSCLNPLQYLPVVGTIYRAVTGDTIPAPVREVGSLVVSGLTGGPVGVGISLGMDAIEHAVGFDEEKFGQSVLAAIGIGKAPAAQSGGGRAVAMASGGQAAGAFSASDLAAFGIKPAADGSADTLNAMELSRIANVAYAKAGALKAAA
jgi:hypothetical protein